ncbi:hypothetical protein PLICRDRAFT_104322 [Plicaturopsis crispa FD-325 SS-3]|nr:hypothetical protein PLICRDRAFT_104322 [Plicaturopsis crispa FD-325 SS-3]
MTPTAPAIGNDFSTNRHSILLEDPAAASLPPGRHPDICFNDGNVAILTGGFYFLVHQGLLCRHSTVLEGLLADLNLDTAARRLEGQPTCRRVCPLNSRSSSLAYDGSDISLVSGLLRMFTKYRVMRLRGEALRGLSLIWPSTISLWESRETKATDSAGVYAPRQAHPHPILVIQLARDVDAPELLPSAFYDLSRCLPSDAALGYTSTDGSGIHHLANDDLLNLLRGREHTSRFLSTFIVNELEGRAPAEWCLNRDKPSPAERRACQVAFESVTFEILRDVNGIVCNRNSDPLYAIAEAELMQTRDDVPGGENRAAVRACEACRAEFGSVVDAAREDFWARLPQWFGVEVPHWG